MRSTRALVVCWGNAVHIEPAVKKMLAISQALGHEILVLTSDRGSAVRYILDGFLAIDLDTAISILSPVDSSGFYGISQSTIDESIAGDIATQTAYPGMIERYKLNPKSSHLQRYEILLSKEFYLWQAQAVFGVMESLFDIYQPELLYVWNGTSMAFISLPVHIAKNRRIQTIYLERGLLPDTLVYDELGVNYASHLAGKRWSSITKPSLSKVSFDKLHEYQQNFVRSKATIVSGIAREAKELRESLGIRIDQKVVLVPLQIESDTNIMRYSPVYKKMSQLVNEVANVFSKSSAFHIIVKPHPENKTSNLGMVESANLSILPDVIITSLFAIADLVVCINSTVGLEAAIHGLPVVTLGNSNYTQKGFTYDLVDFNSIEEAIFSSLRRHPFEAELIRLSLYNYLFYILNHHLLPLEESIFNGKANLEYMLKSADENRGDIQKAVGLSFSPLSAYVSNARQVIETDPARRVAIGFFPSLPGVRRPPKLIATWQIPALLLQSDQAVLIYRNPSRIKSFLLKLLGIKFHTL